MPQYKTDEELMAELQRDRVEAFDLLYGRHAARIKGWGLKKGLSHELAEELVQAVFSKVFRRRELYQARFRFLQWLYVIARSEWIDLRRREGRQEHENDQKMSHNFADQRSDQEELVSRNQGIDQRLSGVTDQERQILEMRFLEEKSFREIAQIIGASEVSLRQRLRRLLLRLKGET